jgi:ubiquinone/menaquinone biosynthesis C-methylase UbiE
MITLSRKKQAVMEYMDRIAEKRDSFIKQNIYYYVDLVKLLRFNIPEGASILEIGCGTGFLLNKLNPKRGIGIDISGNMIARAKEKYPDQEFLQMDAENITLQEQFY